MIFDVDYDIEYPDGFWYGIRRYEPARRNELMRAYRRREWLIREKSSLRGDHSLGEIIPFKTEPGKWWKRIAWTLKRH